MGLVNRDRERIWGEISKLISHVIAEQHSVFEYSDWIVAERDLEKVFWSYEDAESYLMRLPKRKDLSDETRGKISLADFWVDFAFRLREKIK